jgi:hypothetical protein
MDNVETSAVRAAPVSQERFQVYNFFDRAIREENTCRKIVFVALYVIATLATFCLLVLIDFGVKFITVMARIPVRKALRLEHQLSLGKAELIALNESQISLLKAANKEYREGIERLGEVVTASNRARKADSLHRDELKEEVRVLKGGARESEKIIKEAQATVKRKRQVCRRVTKELKALKAPGLGVRIAALIDEALGLEPHEVKGLVASLEKKRSVKNLTVDSKARSKRNLRGSGATIDGATGQVGDVAVAGDEAKKKRVASLQQVFASALRRRSTANIE